MLEAWELWLLVVYALFQGAVAAWWWRGPALAGTRAWGAALFGLNALATLAMAVGDATGIEPFGDAGAVADVGTNLCQLGFALAAIAPYARLERIRLPILVLAALALLLVTPALFSQGVLPDDWGPPLQEGPLVLAMSLTAVALVAWSRRPPSPERSAWVLVLGALAMRHAEIELVYFRYATGPQVIHAVHGVMQVVALVSTLAALALLAWPRARASGGPGAREIEVAIAFVASGLLLGFSNLTQIGPRTAVYFSLGLVRPAVFMIAQSRLAGERVLARRDVAVTLAGGVIVAFSLLGLLVAGLLWRLALLPSLAVTIGFAGLGFPLGRWVFDALGARREAQGGAGVRSSPGEAADPGVAFAAVPLPPDWRDRVASSREAHARLPPAARARLARLARWQRLVLALDAVSAGALPNAYERTTPGLHFVTHCPYPSIGPEIRRLNARWRVVLEELGIEPPNLVLDPGQVLVAGTWGRAQGLDSGRARIYALTPVGREVARALREGAGLVDLSPGEVAAVVGEAWASGSDNEVQVTS